MSGEPKLAKGSGCGWWCTGDVPSGDPVGWCVGDSSAAGDVVRRFCWTMGTEPGREMGRDEEVAAPAAIDAAVGGDGCGLGDEPRPDAAACADAAAVTAACT